MAFLTNEQKKSFGGFISAAGYVLTCAVMVALANKFLMTETPGYIEWLMPFTNLILVLGAIAAGVVIYSNNKLIKN